MGTIEKYRTPGGIEGYLARESYLDPATGKRIYRKQRFQASKYGGLRKARDEAEAWLNQRAADRTRGLVWEPSRESLGSVLDRWAAQLGPPLTRSTITQYRSTIRARFTPAERSIPVGELTPGHVRRMLARWQRAELASETINKAWGVLRMALGLVRDEGGIQGDPLAGIKRGTTRREPLETWTPEQVRAFLDQTQDDRLGHVWAVMFATCCRIGEACALRWDDIDAGVITIRRSWSRGVIAERTKTGDVRRVPIPTDLVARLELVRRASAGPWVAALGDRPATPNHARDLWDRAVLDSGLPRLTPHGARHTGATNLISAGVPVGVVARILGHRDPAMTLRRYVHPDEVDAINAANVLGALYRGDVSLSGAQSAPKVVPITKKTG